MSLDRRLPLQAAVSLVAVALAVGGVPARAQHQADESRLKTAFVYQFPQWTEWPAQALTGRQTFDYCVSAPARFTPLLRELVAAEMIGGRRQVVRELAPIDSAAACHVLFVSGAVNRSVLERVAAHPVLTIGDSARFLDDGGIIQLVRAGNNLRFNINVAAAQRAGLRLSSHLLGLAENLRRGQP